MLGNMNFYQLEIENKRQEEMGGDIGEKILAMI